MVHLTRQKVVIARRALKRGNLRRLLRFALYTLQDRASLAMTSLIEREESH